jgi:hypothetical protein
LTVGTPQVRGRYVFAGLAAGEAVATVLLLVRVHVLGREERQRLALGTPLALHCP